jgi:hypothetical protein
MATVGPVMENGESLQVPAGQPIPQYDAAGMLAELRRLEQF